MKYADLHMHTTASDGTDSLMERVDDAQEKGLDCIAITDHDTFNEELGTRSMEVDGVEVITGCEIKAGLDGKKVEILAYFLDPAGDGIQELLDRIKEYRHDRMQQMIDRLEKGEGFDLSMDEVEDLAHSSIARPHLAKLLVNKDIVQSMGEAFDRYIGGDQPYYVETQKVSAREVIETVHSNGGVASLAHPGRSLRKEEAFEKVKKLKQYGLDAIEVDYTYEQLRESYSRGIHFGSEYAAKIADRLDLLATGGSDCHGSRSDKYFLGSIKVPYDSVVELDRYRQEHYSK